MIDRRQIHEICLAKKVPQSKSHFILRHFCYVIVMPFLDHRRLIPLQNRLTVKSIKTQKQFLLRIYSAMSL